jgi:hypothetical protein
MSFHAAAVGMEDVEEDVLPSLLTHLEVISPVVGFK